MLQRWRSPYKIKGHLASLGFPEPAVFDSGNGTYLIYTTDLSPELKPLVRAFIEHISKQFSTRDENPGAKSGLMIRCGSCRRFSEFQEHGTRRSKSTPERPHRRAWIISIPKKRELVTAAMLSSVVPVGGPEEEPEDGAGANRGETIDRSNEVLQRHIAWLKARKVQYAVEKLPDGSTLLRFKQCPFKSKVQEDGRAWLRVSKWGTVTAGCFHAHCESKTLEDLYQNLRWEEWLESEDLKRFSSPGAGDQSAPTGGRAPRSARGQRPADLHASWRGAIRMA